MSRTDVISKWAGSIAFALSTTSPRRLLLSEDPAALAYTTHGQRMWDYVEIDARGVKGATCYYSFNGTLATATLATAVRDGPAGPFRLPPDSIDRVYIRATSISVLAQGNATTVYINVARY